MSLVSSIDDADWALACMGFMIQHDNFEVPALQLGDFFTKVLVGRDEDNQMLRPVVGMILQHMHETVCSLRAELAAQHQFNITSFVPLQQAVGELMGVPEPKSEAYLLQQPISVVCLVFLSLPLVPKSFHISKSCQQTKEIRV